MVAKVNVLQGSLHLRFPISLAFSLLVLFSGLLYIFITTLSLTNGKYIYPLDDTYIHLSLAANIANGTYGVNEGEISAPASSILWPFLLVPFARISWFEYSPLIINVLLAVLTAALYYKFVSPILTVLSDRQKTTTSTLIVSALILTTNLIGLCFVGMEHILQVMLTLLIVTGTIKMVFENKVPVWFVVSLVIAPFVRYECLAFVVPSLLLMARSRRWILLSLVTSLLMVGLVGFSTFIKANGNGWLPSSILAKTIHLTGSLATSVKNELPHPKALSAIFYNVIGNLHQPQGRMIAIMLLIMVVYFTSVVKKNKKLDTPDSLFAIFIILGLSGHLVLGQSGWWGRYEVYAVAAGVFALFWTARFKVQAMLIKLPLVASIIIMMIIASFGLDYTLNNIFLTPKASRDIYEQQYQMHRFVTEWHNAPVAVHDLGWVSLGNPNYVLDLWGLANYTALQNRLSANEPDWMDEMSQSKNVELVMIYTEAFPEIPKNWSPLAHLRLSERRTANSGEVVTFYAVNTEAIPVLKSQLEDFRRTLPKGVMLELIP